MDKKTRIISCLIMLGAVIALVLLDFGTKMLAENSTRLQQGDSIMVIPGIISFRLAYNTGAGFSILEGKKFLLSSISIIASASIFVFMFIKGNFKKEPVLTSSLVLLEAGCFGNLIDRVFYEKGVIDFFCLEFIDFPIFNVADLLLTCGTILLAVYVIFFYKEDKPIKQGE